MKNEVGRPTVITEEVLLKLEHAFGIGASDNEACFYANISPSSLYKYQEKNPKFTERKLALKENPILKARQTINNNLSEPDVAKWYLERKRKEEFGAKLGIEVSKADEEWEQDRKDLTELIKQIGEKDSTSEGVS